MSRDAAMLRTLAERALRDSGEPRYAAAITLSRLALAQALEPGVVLDLLDEARVERASFESACDAAQELDARLEQLAAKWDDRGDEQCADELRVLLEERR